MDWNNSIKKVIEIEGKTYTTLPNAHLDEVERTDDKIILKYVVDDNWFENGDYLLYCGDSIDLELTYEERTKLLNSYTDYIRNLIIETTDYTQKYPEPQLYEFIENYGKSDFNR